MKHIDRSLEKAMANINHLFTSDEKRTTWSLDHLRQQTGLSLSLLHKALEVMVDRKQVFQHSSRTGSLFIVSGGHRKALREQAKLIKR